jgi:hypothetical protein
MRRFTWFLVCVAVAIGIAIYLNRETISLYREQIAKQRTAEAEMARHEDAKAKLLREKARLQSPVGREEEARKSGYRREGEKQVTPN